MVYFRLGHIERVIPKEIPKLRLWPFLCLNLFVSLLVIRAELLGPDLARSRRP